MYRVKREPIAKDVRCAFLLALCLAGCIVVAPKPNPDPPKPTPATLEVTVRTAARDHLVGLAAVYRDVATDVPATEQELYKTLHDRDVDTTKDAFRPLDKMFGERIGGAKYDAVEARKLLIEMATAFEGAAK